jgi:2-keto-4-pentenoate hydratase
VVREPFDPVALARRLDAALRARTPIEPPSDGCGLDSIELAYATQRAWAELRLAGGDRIAGRKIGLTSPAMQRQMGVDEPDYGDLWASCELRHRDGAARIGLDAFVQPRVEGELAFRLGRELSGDDVDERAVLEAVEAAAPAIEIVDSRIADWRIELVDTVADNASFGAFLCGDWSASLAREPLAELPMRMLRDGREVVAETGAAVLGSPLTAVAWLARKLSSFGVPLRAGDIVLSGSFGGALPIAPGDEYTVAIGDRPPLTARFEADAEAAA